MTKGASATIGRTDSCGSFGAYVLVTFRRLLPSLGAAAKGPADPPACASFLWKLTRKRFLFCGARENERAQLMPVHFHLQKTSTLESKKGHLSN